MRKNSGTLNPALSRILSELGHTDELLVTDAGLPIPAGVERIDLALTPNVPEFLQCLDVVLAEVEVEAAIAASEIATHSPELHAALRERLDALNIRLELVPHTAFKERTKCSKAAVRSGEFTSYANVILIAGVVY
ncbi:D-ribose pyranase [Arthrobacter livingstonensis]|uniref:D-ribose pyranase n=1 Tax=Arthrobacter livingstonensis TaxID=670078 RepID=A0A2V5LYS6_9MICC|nr:D-ribose pyranase [Arthrobacter livingstonensis]PYI69087.1 D-ribose pyranase [Arthrobacter livingstonensis]